MTLEDINYRNKLNGTLLRDHPDVEKLAALFPVYKKENTTNIPDSFDGRYVWRDFINEPDFLGDCANDWALSLVTVMSDRFMLLTLNQINTLFSSTGLLYCDPRSKPIKFIEPPPLSQKGLVQTTCCGHSIYDAAIYAYIFGVTEASCFSKIELLRNKFELPTRKDPSSYKCEDLIGKNREHCLDKTVARRVFRLKALVNVSKDSSSIKADIYRFGPSVAGMILYDDFRDVFNGNGIYMGPKEGAKSLGGCSIRLVGWGNENGVDYWIASMNWSQTWGIRGYFKIKQYIPGCMLEDNVVSPIVDLLGTQFNPNMNFTPPEEWLKLRSQIVVDPKTFYPIETLNQIKAGVLQGDLGRLIDNVEDLPKYSNFLAGNVDIYRLKSREKSIEKRKTSRKIVYIKYVILAIVGLLIGWTLHSVVFKKKSKRSRK
jgi:cathepsin B